MNDKQQLRAAMRRARRDHVEALPASVSRLVFNRPPGLIAERLKPYGTVGIYLDNAAEAPTRGWISWLAENGWRIALPAFDSREKPMHFRLWDAPWDEASLQQGPFRQLQPPRESEIAIPEALIVPILAFTPRCDRLGQGGGHYDRWLVDHPPALTIGLAWDIQQVDKLPLEPHDQPLDLVVTPTRIHERQP